MKRVCSLCLQEVIYHMVKKYPHGLQLCVKCQDVLLDITDLAVESKVRRF